MGATKVQSRVVTTYIGLRSLPALPTTSAASPTCAPSWAASKSTRHGPPDLGPAQDRATKPRQALQLPVRAGKG